MEGADGAHYERRRQIGGQHHVNEPERKRRIEDHIPPAGRHELPVRDGVPGWSLHPAVGRQYPESGDERADCHQQSRQEMQPLTDALHTEKHHSEEAGFQKKSRQHLITQQWTEHRSGPVGKGPPVGSELVAHDDAGNDAHTE